MLMGKERQSNFELLRLIAMFFIVLSHIAVLGRGTVIDRDSFTPLSIFIHFSAGLGQVGNNLFILLTGYFLVKGRWKSRKIVTLILQTLFYSWGFFLIFYFGKFYTFTREEMIANLFPILFKTNWFISCYLCFIFFSPFLNLLLRKINRKQHLFLCLFCFFLWSILYIWKTETYLNDFAGFIEVYLIGAYFGLSPVPFKKKASVAMGSLALPLLLAFYALLVYLGTKYDFFLRKADDFTRFYSVSSILVSVSIFLWAREWKVQSKVINALASSVFGVYLIHYNFCVRKVVLPWLYTLLTPLAPSLHILVLPFLALGIFFVCLLLEKLRALLMNKLLLQKILKKISFFDRIDSFFSTENQEQG